MNNYFQEHSNREERYRSFNRVIKPEEVRYQIFGQLPASKEEYFDTAKLYFQQRSRIFPRPHEAPTDPIQLPNWKEFIPCTENFNEFPESQLILGIIDSYQIQAQRAGYISGLNPVMVSGISLTRDNRIILGVRGGTIEPNKISLIPMGFVSYNPLYSQNLLHDSVYAETEEELGWKKDQLDKTDLVGLVLGDKNEPTYKNSVKFVFLLYNNITTSTEVLQRHNEAIILYNELTEKGLIKKEIEAQLIEKGFYESAWEHKRLLSLEPSYQNLNRIVKEGLFKNHQLIDMARSDVALAMTLLKNI